MRVYRGILVSASISLFLLVCLGPAIRAQGSPALQASASRNLLNGLHIEILANPQQDQVALHLLIGAGSTMDPAGKAGLAELTAALLLDSVPDWQGDPSEIRPIIEAGKTFRSLVDWDSTHLFTQCRAEEIDIYLKALARFVRNSTLSQNRFPAVRDALLQKIQKTAPTPLDRALLRFDAELFRGHVYSRPLSGTPETLSRISYGETVLFQRRVHLPNVSYLAAVGPVDADQVRTLAGRALGIWIMEEAFPFTFNPPRPVAGLDLVLEPGSSQQETVLLAGQLGLARNASDFSQLQLLADILTASSGGQWQVLAEGRRMRGSLRLQAAGKALPAARILSDFRRQLQAMRDEGPTPDAVRTAAQSWVGRLLADAQQGPRLARLLCEISSYQLGFNFLERQRQIMPGLTAADLKLTAQRALDPQNLLAVIHGPVTAADLQALQNEGWKPRSSVLPNAAGAQVRP